MVCRTAGLEDSAGPAYSADTPLARGGAQARQPALVSQRGGGSMSGARRHAFATATAAMLQPTTAEPSLLLGCARSTFWAKATWDSLLIVWQRHYTKATLSSLDTSVPRNEFRGLQTFGPSYWQCRCHSQRQCSEEVERLHGPRTFVGLLAKLERDAQAVQ